MCWVELGHIEDVGWEEPQENGQCGEKNSNSQRKGKNNNGLKSGSWPCFQGRHKDIAVSSLPGGDSCLLTEVPRAVEEGGPQRDS